MQQTREVMVVAGARTAIGDFGGGLSSALPTALAAIVVRETLRRAQVEGHEVEQNALATESHHREARAIDQGKFESQIIPVPIRTGQGDAFVSVDEHVRGGTTVEQLDALKPAFQKGGAVTAGNASSLNDGAAAVMLMERTTAERRQLMPLGRLVSYAHSGVDPLSMGVGPVPATRIALQRAGLTHSDIDVIEVNEAFAAQARAVAKELRFDASRVNPNGSGISLGQSIGAPGAIINVKPLYKHQAPAPAMRS